MSSGDVIPGDDESFFRPPSRPRRCRILRISTHLLLDSLFSQAKVGDEVRSLEIEGLPKGCEATRVHYNYEADCFEFLVYHDSFDVVPDGEIPPPIWPALTMRVWKVDKEDADVHEAGVLSG